MLLAVLARLLTCTTGPRLVPDLSFSAPFRSIALVDLYTKENHTGSKSDVVSMICPHHLTLSRSRLKVGCPTEKVKK